MYFPVVHTVSNPSNTVHWRTFLQERHVDQLLHYIRALDNHFIYSEYCQDYRKCLDTETACSFFARDSHRIHRVCACDLISPKQNALPVVFSQSVLFQSAKFRVGKSQRTIQCQIGLEDVNKLIGMRCHRIFVFIGKLFLVMFCTHSQSALIILRNSKEVGT